ncbi:MAG: alkaline phosphatase D family protein [Methylotetracoccus sp.]|nr:alkaline phosphatase D family protein [Methylotetracoccus sp.]
MEIITPLLRLMRLAALPAVVWCSHAVAASTEERAPTTHGVMAGAVTHDSVIIWSRTDRETTMHVWLRPSAGGAPSHAEIAVNADHDFTGKLRFHGLKPNSDYQYAVRFGGDATVPRHDPASGSFRTAPPPSAPQAVRFASGGALGGQNVCRDSREGFPIFDVLTRTRWDFFVAIGDMIHADQPCEPRGAYGNEQIPGAVGPATTKPEYWAYWKYSREDRALRDFLAVTPYFPMWDDHEVVDAFGPLHDTRDAKPYKAGQHLLPIGLDAFIDYNPIVPGGETPLRLYRNVRWGKHVELFLLDTRQYRDSNMAEDSAETPKTLLGREQLTWLKKKLKESDATWKFIVSSVPISTPTGRLGDKYVDGWANGEQRTGFEQELLQLLTYIREEKIYNSIWLAADLHRAQSVRLRPYRNDASLTLYEFTSGPMNAGLLASPVLDQTLKPERLFAFGVEDPAAVATFAQAKHWMNVGAVEVADSGTLTFQIINAEGQAVWKREPLKPR